MKNNIVKPNLPLNTPLILKAWHKVTLECFEKKITYADWVEFEKHKDYYYNVYQLI
jgi:hypothetical protein